MYEKTVENPSNLPRLTDHFLMIRPQWVISSVDLMWIYLILIARTFILPGDYSVVKGAK